jgi:hypothetical protein
MHVAGINFSQVNGLRIDAALFLCIRPGRWRVLSLDTVNPGICKCLSNKLNPALFALERSEPVSCMFNANLSVGQANKIDIYKMLVLLLEEILTQQVLQLKLHVDYYFRNQNSFTLYR